MSYRRQVALGLAGGYLLGRFRKTRWLAMAVALVASKRLSSAVSERATAAVGSSPELKKLSEQGREAAVGLVGGQIQALTDRVKATTESLRPPQPQAEGTGDGDGEQQPEAESGGGQQPEAESGGGQQPEAESGGGQQPEAESGGGQQPDAGPAGGQQPEAESGGEQQPDAGPAGGQQPEAESGGGEEPDRGERAPARSSGKRTAVTGRPGRSAAGREKR